jgi:hypothetical protein
VDLEEDAAVSNPPDQFAHVIGAVGLIRDERVELFVARKRVSRLAPRRVVEIVGRDVREQLPDAGQDRLVAAAHEVSHP